MVTIYNSSVGCNGFLFRQYWFHRGPYNCCSHAGGVYKDMENKKINNACGQLIYTSWLTANKYTGSKKKENGKRSNCIVDFCIVG